MEAKLWTIVQFEVRHQKSPQKKSLDSTSTFCSLLCLLEEFDKYLKWKMMTNQKQQKRADTIKQKYIYIHLYKARQLI